jgi:hypothetical protein
MSTKFQQLVQVAIIREPGLSGLPDILAVDKDGLLWRGTGTGVGADEKRYTWQLLAGPPKPTDSNV